jgi:pimeloyl-ACP methyl ester carboxylesterase
MQLSIGSRTLHYSKTGHGPIPVLLLPGGPGFTRDYLFAIHQSLPENEFTVVSFNPSGTIGNVNAPFYKSIVAFAGEVMEVLDALSLSNVYLLGHSWGTTIAQEFLVQYPDLKVRGVILVNGFSSGAQLAEAIKKRLLDLPVDFDEKRKALLAKETVTVSMRWWVSIGFHALFTAYRSFPKRYSKASLLCMKQLCITITSGPTYST